VHERHRIGAARQRHEDASAAPEQRVTPNGPKDPLRDVHFEGKENGGGAGT
jgi:hypothetical protein